MESFPMAFSSEADVHSNNSNARTEGRHHSHTEDQDRLALLHRARAKLSLSNRGGLLPEPHPNPLFANQEYGAPSNGQFVGHESGFHLSQENYPNSLGTDPVDRLRRAREKLSFSNREAHSNGGTDELERGPTEHRQQREEEANIQSISDADVSPLERLRLARARLRSCVNSLPGASASEPPSRAQQRGNEVRQSRVSDHPSHPAILPEGRFPDQVQQLETPEVVHHGDDMDIESESESGSPWREEENDAALDDSSSESHIVFGVDVRKTFYMEPEPFEVPVEEPSKVHKNVEMDVDSSSIDMIIQDGWAPSNNKTDQDKFVPETNNLDIFIINKTRSFMKDYSESKKTSHISHTEKNSQTAVEDMEIESDGTESEPEVQVVESDNQQCPPKQPRLPIDQPIKDVDLVFSLNQPPPPPPPTTSETTSSDSSPSVTFVGFTSPPPLLQPQLAGSSPIPSVISPPVPVPPPQFPISALPAPVPAPVPAPTSSLPSVPQPVPPPFVTFAALPTPVPSPLVTMAIAHSSVPRKASAVPTPVPPPQPNTSITPDSGNKIGSFLGFSLSSILPTLDGKPSPVPPPAVDKASKPCAASKSSDTAVLPGKSKSSRSSPAAATTSKPRRSSPIPPTSSSRSSRVSPAPPHVASKPAKPHSKSDKPSKPSSGSARSSNKSGNLKAGKSAVTNDLTSSSPKDPPFAQAAQPPPKEAMAVEKPPETNDNVQESLFSLIPPPPPAGSLDLDEVENVNFSFTRLPPPQLGDFSFTRMPPPFFNAEPEHGSNVRMPFTRFLPPRLQGPHLRPRGAPWLQGRPPGPGSGRGLLPTPTRPTRPTAPSARPPLLPTPKPNFRLKKSRWGDYSPLEEIQAKPEDKAKGHSEKHRHGEGKGKGSKHSSGKSDRTSTHQQPSERADSDSDSSIGAYDGAMHDAGDYPSDDEMDSSTLSAKSDSDKPGLKIQSCTSLKLDTGCSDAKQSQKSPNNSHSSMQLNAVPPIKIKVEVEEPELEMDFSDFAVNVKPDPDGEESLHTSIDLDVAQEAIVKIEPTEPIKIKVENSYLCTECGKRFNEKFYLEAHLYDHLEVFTGKHPYKCAKCPGRVFKDMKIHRHHHMMGLECDVCGEAFHAAISLAEHRMRVHMAKKGYPCSVCNKRYPTVTDLAHHQKKRHSKPKKYKCKKCSKCFNHSDYLAKHIQNQHPEDRPSGSKEQPREKEKEVTKPSATSEPISCPHCQEDFATKDMLDEHIQSNHTESQEKQDSCEVCEETFPSLEDLQTHIATHGENPFQCEDCDARFPHKKELKEHSRKHRMHKCVLCGYITSCSSSLLKHMKVHDDKKGHENAKTESEDPFQSNPEQN